MSLKMIPPCPDLNGRNVIYMKLHSEYFVVNLGPIKTTVSLVGDGNPYKSLVMTKVPEGVYCVTESRDKTKEKRFEFLIPNGNIMGVTFGD